eukprot:3676105-Pleurochrysis_carterae.AAC.1
MRSSVSSGRESIETGTEIGVAASTQNTSTHGRQMRGGTYVRAKAPNVRAGVARERASNRMCAERKLNGLSGGQWNTEDTERLYERATSHRAAPRWRFRRSCRASLSAAACDWAAAKALGSSAVPAPEKRPPSSGDRAI